MKSQPHGFSFFNNIAIAANYLIQNKLAKKIVIVDWDAHHGEGTQKIFYGRKDVLYISLHRFDNGKFFPHIA
jgi:histone deacetylase 6